MRIRQGHDGQSIVIKVAQHRYGSILLRLAWDPSIKGFIYDKMVHGFRVTQWYIWDHGIMCSDCLGQLIERVFVQALLEDKKFLVGRTIMSLIKLILLR